MSGSAGPVDIERAVVRRGGTDATIVSYGGALHVATEAAEQLVAEKVSAEVIDLRALRPLDETSIVESVARTHRLVIVDEGRRSVIEELDYPRLESIHSCVDFPVSTSSPGPPPEPDRARPWDYGEDECPCQGTTSGSFEAHRSARRWNRYVRR